MDFNQFAQRLEQMASGANAAARRAYDVGQMNQQKMAEMAAEVHRLQGALDGLKVRSQGGSGGPGASSIGRPDMLTIEEIPGRRIPFDLTVQIGIPDNQRSPLQGNYTLSMDGPFVAVARYATFISTYSFQVTDGQANVQRYAGRSWGRQRPISSVLDLMDAVGGWVDGTTETLVGDCDTETPVPALVSRPASRSPFRTMGFDGYVSLKNAVYPRQNQQIPTSLWAPGFNQMLQLPVLDYFEKGDALEFEVEPMHINNPNAGNIQSLLGSMPYLNGQYDGHEGIMYPAWSCDPNVADIIQRRPQGILVVGLLGFRILQPPGVRLR
jgi:hypothetical protein